jgi:tetratricopeptide (TPR) repeat protein
LLETGQVAEAKRGYDELLNRPGIRQSGEIYWSILFDRGRIAEQEKQIKDAITFYTEAVDTIELQRSTIHTEASKIGFVGDKQAVYHHLIRALYQDRQHEKAFEYVGSAPKPVPRRHVGR